MRFQHWSVSLVGFLVSVRAFDEAQWEKTRRLDDAHIVTAYVVFHQPRIDEASNLLLDISNPQSKKFGQYLDASEVEQMFAPARETLDQTLAWLENAGIHRSISKLHSSSSVLHFSAPVSQIRKLLNADVHLLRHRSTGEERLQESGYPVPQHLANHVEFITIRSKILQKMQSRSLFRKDIGPPVYKSPPPAYTPPTPPNLANCSENWTPTCIRQLYSIPLGTKAAPNNTIGIFGYGDLYVPSDLDKFFTKYASFIPKGTRPKFNDINGAKAVSEYIDGEQSLDLQMAYPIAYPQTVTIYQTPYSQLDGMANDFLDAVDASYCKYDGGDDPVNDPTFPAFQGFPGPAMCGTYKPPHVLSISFAKDEGALPRHYVERQCHEWMKLALQGTSMFISSGDRGVSGNFGCAVNPTGGKGEAFNPSFPVTCPYVTAVGATQVNFTKKGQYQEVAVYDKKHNYWSGGGFSNYLARPKWQDKAVKAYFATHDPHYPAGTFNVSGRGYPDVSMLGANVTISDQGEFVVSGGTSAAAPLFAALISRINDERILAGKKPIGFLNQILYQHPEVFNDITDGSNPGCDTPGFQTAKGWDPVSGLGSPVFPKLRQLLVGLP